LAVSVGVRIARSVVAPTTVGVHEQVAEPSDARTLAQAVIVSLPLTNATLPGIGEVAEIVTGDPYFVVVTEPGSESARVGVALETVKVTVTGVVPVEPAASVTVIV
jgi:hypothetical protein